MLSRDIPVQLQRLRVAIAVNPLQWPFCFRESRRRGHRRLEVGHGLKIVPIPSGCIHPHPVGAKDAICARVKDGLLNGMKGLSEGQGQVEALHPQVERAPRQRHRPGRCDAVDACPHDRRVNSKFCQLACRFQRICGAEHRRTGHKHIGPGFHQGFRVAVADATVNFNEDL